jgi:hypothetical protein
LGLSSADERLLFLFTISVFIALLGMGVIRRWRWAFWLILVAFLFGPLRAVASVLALGGGLPADGPTWYVLYQALLGLVQFVIALFMVSGYRRAGTWGRSEVSTPGSGFALEGHLPVFLSPRSRSSERSPEGLIHPTT